MALKVDSSPHFGFLCAGGVFQMHLTVSNLDPRANMKLYISLLAEGQRNRTKPHQIGENHLKVLTTHPRILPAGMTTTIRLVVFAVRPQHFCDTFEIHTSTGIKSTIKISAYIFQPDAWASVLMRLRVEDRPILRPGVHCLGSISHGHHKFLVQHMPHLGPAPLRSPFTWHNDAPQTILSIFPEDMELPGDDDEASSSSVDKNHSNKRIQLLHQEDDVAELRRVPFVDPSYWDIGQSTLKLSKDMLKAPVNPHRPPEEHIKRVEEDRMLATQSLEGKGFISSRLISMARQAAAVDDEREGEEEGEGVVGDDNDAVAADDAKVPSSYLPEVQQRQQPSSAMPSSPASRCSLQPATSPKRQSASEPAGISEASAIEIEKTIKYLARKVSDDTVVSIQLAPANEPQPPPSYAAALQDDAGELSGARSGSFESFSETNFATNDNSHNPPSVLPPSLSYPSVALNQVGSSHHPPSSPSSSSSNSNNDDINHRKPSVIYAGGAHRWSSHTGPNAPSISAQQQNNNDNNRATFRKRLSSFGCGEVIDFEGIECGNDASVFIRTNASTTGSKLLSRPRASIARLSVDESLFDTWVETKGKYKTKRVGVFVGGDAERLRRGSSGIRRSSSGSGDSS